MNIKNLYGSTVTEEEFYSRIDYLAKKHFELFNAQADAFFSTSGRTELGGNHTDHNLGCVLAGSINLDTIAAVHETPDYTVTIISDGFKPVCVDISNLDPRKDEIDSTNGIVRGMAASIAKRGGILGGFCANTNSTVLKGSGLSSSAAIEVLVGTIFNHMFNNDRFSTTELAIMGQEAENNYFGKPCGLMDQIACANGGIVGIDFKEPKNPVISPVKVDFTEFGYDLVVVGTGGSHADLTADYASIPQEMKAVAKYFGKEVLRDVSMAELLENSGKIREAMNNDRAFLRAYHFLAENQRAQDMVKALEAKDINSYFGLINSSGNSSFKYLQNIYSPNAPKEQGISLALAMTENFLNGQGAYRVQGGGFAGTIQAYIPVERTEEYFTYMAKMFKEGCCHKLAIRNVPTSRII